MTVINIKRNLFFLAVLSISQLSVAQNIEFKNTNFKSDKEGLKVAKGNLKIADKFRENALLDVFSMQDASLESESAFLYYQKAHIFNPNNSDLNYKIASVLLFTNKKEFAKEYLNKAIYLSEELPDEFNFFQGMVWQLEGEYGKAVESYQDFRNNAKKKTVEKQMNF